MSEKRYAMFLAVMVAELPQDVSVRHIALDKQVDANLAEVFGDGLRTQGIAFLGLSVEDADSYPVLTGQFSNLYPWDPLDRAGLHSGDRVVRVGDTDLRGVGNALRPSAQLLPAEAVAERERHSPS